MSQAMQTPPGECAGAPASGRQIAINQEAQALYDALYPTESWVQVAKVLHRALGLTQAEIARGADVTTATVARWLESPDEASVRAVGRLDDLRYAVLWMACGCGMGPRLIRFWLTAKNPYLGQDPLGAIAAGRFEQVIEIARAFGEARSAAGR
jgi:hypothetical protein